MGTIQTITLNPTIDLFGRARAVRPTHKIRMSDVRYEPGGGGINVARVISVLGGAVEAGFLAGGEMGQFLCRLLAAEGIRHRAIAIDGQTRLATIVFDQTSGEEYRFLPDGPTVTEAHVAASAAMLETGDGGFAVASGSLPPGAPADSYARIARAAAAKGLRFVLDSSGEGLRAAVAAGGIHLMKPSRGELEQLAGQSLDEAGLAAKASQLVRSGKAEIIAVTLGAEGAMLVTKDGTLRVPAIPVDVRSAVGAGDSFLGAMVWALSQGWTVEDAFRLGTAAGAAATMNAGTVLCRREDVTALYRKAGGSRRL
jgi:6-phosphofructokinase 2